MSRPVTINYRGTNNTFHVDYYPSECGLCHKNIDPKFIGGAFVKGDLNTADVEAIFQCTNIKCNKLVIGYYARDDRGQYKLSEIAPVHPVEKDFNKEIQEVSTNFIKIFNQSSHAEQSGLTLISGIGYRKAIEFLIKDYLIYLDKDNEETILNLPLGQCINMLDNPSIKEISKRATWLGNDEAHYTRKWANKDVNDLKKLIEVTVYFIAMDVAAKKYLNEMS